MVINEMRYFSFILLILPICFFSNANARDLRVFAAASTVHLIEDLTKSWEKVSGQKVRVVLGSSGALARQMHMGAPADRSEEHTSELQSLVNLVCRLLLEKKK